MTPVQKIKIERIKKSFWLRLKHDTPKYFKKIRAISLIVGGAFISLTPVAINFGFEKLSIIFGTLATVMTVIVPLICSSAIDIEAILLKDEETNQQ